MASKGKLGIKLNLNKVPCRELKMTPYEIMLSESQERMLIVLENGEENKAKKIFDKWNLDFAVIGKTTNSKKIELYFNKEKNQEETSLKTSKIISTEIDNETGTLIKDINYSFSDSSGNYYELLSEVGKVDINNSDKIFMTNVTAIIYLINASPITITSKHAYYNKKNHETNFFKDVKSGTIFDIFPASSSGKSKTLAVSLIDDLAAIVPYVII